MIMIRNYFVTAIRFFLRQRLYSIINVLGFALGLAAFIMIMLYLNDELSYDKFWPNAERIYRVTRLWKNDDGQTSLHLARVAPPVGPLLKEDYGNYLEEVVRIYGGYTTVISFGDKKFMEDRFFAAEPNIFKVFPNKFLAGDPKTALEEPFTLVLTESMARRYFGNENPIGKSMKYQDIGLFRVTGVIADLPNNTYFKYDFLASFSSLAQLYGKDYLEHNWGGNNFPTYVLFRDKTDPAMLASQLDTFINRHLTPEYTRELGKAPEHAPSMGTQLVLQKLTDIHLHSNLSTEIVANGSIRSIYIFALVAFFIMLIACINFMNLSTARSSARAREVGLRKVVGASRGKLITQFLGESFLMTLVALIIAVTAVDLVMPAFNNYVHKDLSLLIGAPWKSMVAFMVLLVVVSLLAGSYPSFLLSSYNPLSILKGVWSRQGKGANFRTVLVIAQFTANAVLIISIIFIFRQWQFLTNMDLGFDREKLVVLFSNEKINGSKEAFKAKLKENPNILNVGESSQIPSNDLVNSWGGKVVDGPSPGPIPFMLNVVEVDYDFMRTYGMKMAAGRPFSKEFPTDDSMAFILNETAVTKLGWGKPEDGVNRMLEYGPRKGQVIGVVKDIYFESLHKEIAPVIYLIGGKDDLGIYSVKIGNKDGQGTIRYIEDTWYGFSSEGVFSYYFLDEEFRNLYRSERQLGEVTGMFAVLALVIACLGLFGLASYASFQRTKEIGIRKVMGANMILVIGLLSRSFLRWILLANLIAWPVAWYFIHRWLSGFPYRIKIGVDVFLLSLVVTLLIAFLTILYQTLRVARENPVKSLRYE
jgi:putative ABC transport system permease protein